MYVIKSGMGKEGRIQAHSQGEDDWGDMSPHLELVSLFLCLNHTLFFMCIVSCHLPFCNSYPFVTLATGLRIKGYSVNEREQVRMMEGMTQSECHVTLIKRYTNTTKTQR